MPDFDTCYICKTPLTHTTVGAAGTVQTTPYCPMCNQSRGVTLTVPYKRSAAFSRILEARGE